MQTKVVMIVTGQPTDVVTGEQWEVHLYRPERDCAWANVGRDELVRRETLLAHAGALGFADAAGRAAFPELAETVYPSLPDGTQADWNAAAYPHSAHPSASWEQYPYSTPPDEVLEALTQARVDAVFDDLVIWSLACPRDSYRQFVALGVVIDESRGLSTSVYYMIARWGRPLIADGLLHDMVRAQIGAARAGTG